MCGPGAEVPDLTEGLVDVPALPTPTLVAYDRHHAHPPCPRWGPLAARHTCGQRTFHALGEVSTGCPGALLVTYSSHACTPCRKYGNVALSDVALPGSHSTRRVAQVAVRLVVEDGVPSRPARGHVWCDHRVGVPCAPIQHWTAAGGKQGARAEGQRVSGRGACVVCGLRGG